MANENKRSCINLCMYKCIVKAEEAILKNYKDCSLTKEQIGVLKSFYEDFWKKERSRVDFWDYNKFYNMYHKAAIIELKEKHVYSAVVYFLKYIAKKIYAMYCKCFWKI